jgi:hypothetical protein
MVSCLTVERLPFIPVNVVATVAMNADFYYFLFLYRVHLYVIHFKRFRKKNDKIKLEWSNWLMKLRKVICRSVDSLSSMSIETKVDSIQLI